MKRKEKKGKERKRRVKKEKRRERKGKKEKINKVVKNFIVGDPLRLPLKLPLLQLSYHGPKSVIPHHPFVPSWKSAYVLQ